MDIYGEEPADIRDDTAPSKRVGVAESAVSDTGQTLKTSGIGSCLAIGLIDEHNGVAALGHPMLPRFENHKSAEREKFVDTTIDDLLEEIQELGARKSAVEAVIVGGSQMFEFSISSPDRESDTTSVGPRNVEAAHERLSAHGINIRAERTGGSVGRSVKLDSETGEVTVRTASDRETEVI